jgi:hypothetical protein
MTRKRRRGQRFPLLTYIPLGQRWGSLGLLLGISSFILWLFAPRILPPEIGTTLLRHLALVPTLAGIGLTLYGMAARRMAYVQCLGTHLRIRTPFYPLVVSYRRVEGTRPIEMRQVFDPARERAARRLWPRRYWAITAVAVDLRSYPLSRRWLRLWMDRYLFNPDGKGFLFLVDDWMALSRQINDRLTLHRGRQVR